MFDSQVPLAEVAGRLTAGVDIASDNGLSLRLDYRGSFSDTFTSHGGTVRLGSAVSSEWFRQALAQVPAGRSLYDCIADLRPQWGRSRRQRQKPRWRLQVRLVP